MFPRPSLSSSAFCALLIAAGVLVGELAFAYAPYKLVGSGAKVLVAFIGTVWLTVMAFTLKIADVTEAPSLTAAEHHRIENFARRAVRRVWWFAAGNAVAALLVLIPPALVDARQAVWQWQLILAGGAMGFSTFSIIMQASWQEEIRRFRSELRERERHEKELAELLKGMDGAVNNAVLDEIRSLNTKAEWPSEVKAH